MYTLQYDILSSTSKTHIKWYCFCIVLLTLAFRGEFCLDVCYICYFIVLYVEHYLCCIRCQKNLSLIRGYILSLVAFSLDIELHVTSLNETLYLLSESLNLTLCFLDCSLLLAGTMLNMLNLLIISTAVTVSILSILKRVQYQKQSK